jgi:O-antigen/teichoic acid export membrane protein
MTRLRRLRDGAYSVLMANVGARVGALVSLTVATVVVAWAGGPAAVGIYALLRVLPSLAGVITSSGLPGAVTYFLAGPDRDDRRLPSTIMAIALAGGLVGTVLWALASAILGQLFFPGVSLALVVLAGATVLTQLLVATAKSCSQGTRDLPGANWVIFNEEFLFLPAYGALWASGVHGYAAMVWALLLADVAAFALGWARLIGKGFFRQAVTRPSSQLARRIASYGWRAQLGGVISLLNLRLDFILLNLLTGPAVLGVYAIASKFAELLKIPGMALTYVLYPRYAREGGARAAGQARRIMPKAAMLTVGAAVPLWFAAPLVIPLAYGSDFSGAVGPAQVIVFGLALDGVAGVITAYLYGIGRPGLNSWGMAVGLAATVLLDLLLIPPFGASGAAVASAVAYVATTLALIWFYWRVAQDGAAPIWEVRKLSGVDTP